MSELDARLTPPLSAERRSTLPGWVGPDARGALDDAAESPLAAILAATRVIRGGASAPEDRTELSRWVGAATRGPILQALLEQALDAGAEALEALLAFCASSPDARAMLALEIGREVDAVPSADGDADAALGAVRARDELESAAWALGLAARLATAPDEVARAETQVLEAAAGVDEVGQALRTELARSLRGGVDDPWLEAVAELGDGWWLDAWSTSPMSVTDVERLLEAPASNVVQLRVPRARLEQPLAVAASDGMSAADRALEADLGPVLARLCSGDVEVHGVGLDDDALPPGLVVRAGENARFEDLSSVRLEPTSAAPAVRDEIAQAWWVPLGGAGAERRSLVVELGDGWTGRIEIAAE